MKNVYFTTMWNVTDLGKWNTIDCSSSKDDDAAYMMGVERNLLLWIPARESNNWFKQILLQLRQNKRRNQWKESELSSEKRV